MRAVIRQLLRFGVIAIAMLVVPCVAAAADADAASRILVMLRTPPPHYRPGSGYGGYEDAPGRAARRRIARQLARANALVLEDDWPMPVLGIDCFVMRVPAAQSIETTLRELARDPRVQWTQPVNTFHALASSGALASLQPSARLWHLRELHNVSTGQDVSVAIIDSGVDARHPQLSQRVAIDRDFVGTGSVPAESHGTAVAGIIGAQAGDAKGIDGIAPQARLLALRACWEAATDQTLCSSFTLAKALQFAIREHADVINLSLGGPADELLGKLLDAAQARGITTVAAIDPQAADGGFPASHAGVLAVGDASTTAIALPQLRAPGRDIPATLPDGRYGFVSGTSFAAAQVSGLVALMKQLAPKVAIGDAATWSVFPANAAPGSSGMIDACATLRHVAAVTVCADTTAQLQATRR
jgi:hypothetical protein